MNGRKRSTNGQGLVSPGVHAPTQNGDYPRKRTGTALKRRYVSPHLA
ncbi:MAG: hypothetical protein AAF411_18790 [Myxococcota bacterium]